MALMSSVDRKYLHVSIKIIVLNYINRRRDQYDSCTTKRKYQFAYFYCNQVSTILYNLHKSTGTHYLGTRNTHAHTHKQNLINFNAFSKYIYIYITR